MLVPLPPTPRAGTRHAASHVRTNSESEKAPPLGIVNINSSTSTRRASTMLIFGDPADEATGFGVGGEAPDDDGQQQLPAGAEEGGLAGQMRSTIKQRAMRLEDLKLARQNACCDEHGHAAEENPHGPADEARNIMTDLHEITPLVELEREKMEKEEDMKRAARAALKWKKAVSRRAAERVSGEDKNRMPPSGFEDVVRLLLQDSRGKKALNKKKQRGGGATKRPAKKGDVASTGSGQRVSASSSTCGVLDASIDADERRRSSVDGGKSAPECGSGDRKNKKRARGRSQSSFCNQHVERESPTTKQAHSFPQRQPRKSVTQAPRKGSSGSSVNPKKSYHRGRAERRGSNAAVRGDGLDTCNYIDGFAGVMFDPAGSMVNLSVESSVHVTVSDGESPNVHCRSIRNGLQAAASQPLGGRVGVVERQPRSRRKETGVGGDGGNWGRQNQLGEPDDSGGIYLPSGNCVNPAIAPRGGSASEDDRGCRNSGDRRELEIAAAAGTAVEGSLNKSGAGHARRRWLNRAGERSRDGAVAATPVEYAGGQCTVVALDLDRKALHVRQLPGKGERGTHKIVSLSQVSASLGRRSPGLVVLRWSGRHLATIGQGAWRDVCARQAAHRKHVKGSSATGAKAKPSSDARDWDSCELISRHGTRRSRHRRRRRHRCHDEPDFEATFAADVSRMRSNGSKGLYRSLVPSLPRRFFGQESTTTAVTAGANSGFGSCGAGYNNESLEPSCPRQWCCIHGADGLTQIEGAGCLSIGESSMGVLTIEGSCSLESVGGNLPRPMPPPRAAPSSSKALRATARPERRMSESARVCTCPSRPSVPVVASGDAGEGAGVSLPIAPPLRRDERDEAAAAPSRYGGKPTFVTAIPSLIDHANAESAETTPTSVAAAADCAAVDSPRQEQQQVVCCGHGEIDDGHRLDDAVAAATGNNNCNRHQTSVDSTTQEPTHSSSPPPFAAAATAGEATTTAITLSITEAAPKPWTLVNKMFTNNNNTARLRGRNPQRTAQQQARTLPRTAPPGGGTSSSYSNKIKPCPRASSQPSTVGAGPTGADTGCSFQRRDKSNTGQSVEHVAQEQEHQPLGRLRVTQGVAGLTFSRSGCFDPDDGSLGATGSDRGTADGLSARWRRGGSESPHSSSSIWSESSCHSMSESTWSGASSDEEGDQQELNVDGHDGDVDHCQGDVGSDRSSSSGSSKNKGNSGSGTVQLKSAQRRSTGSAIPYVGKGGGVAKDARRRTYPSKDTEGADPEGASVSASVVLAGLQHQAQKELRDLLVEAVPTMDVRIAADVPSAIQTVQIMPPSIVVVAWTALGTAKAAREFLGGGARGMRGVRPGLPVVVVGGESDGEGLRISLEAMGASAVWLWPYKSGDGKEVLKKCLQTGR